MLTVFTDGGSRGNPGESAIGIVISNEEGLLWEKGQWIGVKTNNEAEYLAVKTALKKVLESFSDQAEEVNFFLDSKLVVEQLSKRWKIKEPRMKILAQECWQLMSDLSGKVNFTHVPREENKRADELVNEALDLKLNK